jgi:hypothetical protein
MKNCMSTYHSVAGTVLSSGYLMPVISSVMFVS